MSCCLNNENFYLNNVTKYILNLTDLKIVLKKLIIKNWFEDRINCPQPIPLR